MSRLGLRKGTIRLFFYRVNEVGELDRVLNKEHRNIVSNDVPIALLRIKLDGKSADVACEVRRSLAAGYRRKPYDRGRPLTGALEQVGPRVFRHRFVVLKEAMGCISSGVDDSLRNTLMVKMEDLFAEVKVFEESGASGTDLQAVLVIRNRSTLRRGEHRLVAGSNLMEFAPSANAELLIMHRRRVIVRTLGLA